MVNMLLQLMEEFDAPGLLVATTNLEGARRALFRRFDEVLQVPPPGPEEIEKLLEFKVEHNNKMFIQLNIQNKLVHDPVITQLPEKRLVKSCADKVNKRIGLVRKTQIAAVAQIAVNRHRHNVPFIFIHGSGSCI